jgi:2-polyprenyl-6-hydroxyphenyl methylase/3-demethylubiquinone-9 3-methyltransferase
MNPSHDSLDPKAVEHFARSSDTWWQRGSDFEPLHLLNAARLQFIRDRLTALLSEPGSTEQPLAGLNILDVGCGGGLVAEPLARMGAHVTGLDAEPGAIVAAQEHARAKGLNITYRVGTSHELDAEHHRFDVVLALEVIEHTRKPQAFVDSLVPLIRPGGLVILSTLNRSVPGIMLGKFAAEYVLNWLPRGTHDPRRFIKPKRLAGMLRQAGLRPEPPVGVSLNPAARRFDISRDTRINYILTACRPGPPS